MTQFAKKKQKIFFGLFDPWTCLGLAWACPRPKMASKWMKMKFPDLVTNRKVVDNVENYLNVDTQPNLATRFRENAQKPLFFYIKLLIKKN